MLGVVLGGLAGGERRLWHRRVDRFVETVDSFPALLVVALIQAAQQSPSALSFVVAVALVRVAEVARLVQIEHWRTRADEYALAAKALGAQPFRIWWRHLLPNVAGPALVSTVIGMGSVVLLDVALAFVGVGGATPNASWGSLVRDGATEPGSLRFLLVPEAFVIATVGSTYLLASALRDASSPKKVVPFCRNNPYSWDP